MRMEIKKQQKSRSNDLLYRLNDIIGRFHEIFNLISRDNCRFDCHLIFDKYTEPTKKHNTLFFRIFQKQIDIS